MNNRPLRASLALLLALGSCSAPQPTAADREVQDLMPLKKTYAGVVMGFDPKGQSLDVSIDLQGMMSIDDDTEDAMKREALTAWKKAWKKANPGQHGVLTVRIIDFKGNLVVKETTKV